MSSVQGNVASSQLAASLAGAVAQQNDAAKKRDNANNSTDREQIRMRDQDEAHFESVDETTEVSGENTRVQPEKSTNHSPAKSLHQYKPEGEDFIDGDHIDIRA